MTYSVITSGSNLTSNEFVCSECSSEIIETREGFVCSNCGLIPEGFQKVEYHLPYNADIIQHAVLGTTQIGYKRERLRNAQSAKLEKLNRLHSIRDNKQAVLDGAKIEISRIFTALSLPESYTNVVFKKFKEIRDGLRLGTKFRNPEKLVPIVIYFVLKMRNVAISQKRLLGVSRIEKNDFNAFKFQILKFIPQYAERNRKDFILQKVMGITEDLGLGMEFYYQSKKILYKMWEGIKGTKDDVVAGLVCSLSTLCSFRDQVSVSFICKKLGICMSTIQSQVKKRIIERYHVKGFTSLVRSHELVQEVLVKLSVLEGEESPREEKKEKEDISQELICISLGRAEPIFNHALEKEYYAFIFCDTQQGLNCVSTQVRPIAMQQQKESLFAPSGKEIRNEDFLFTADIVCWPGKGPPESY